MARKTIDVYGLDELEKAFERMSKKYDNKIKATLTAIANTERRRLRQLVSGDPVKVKTGNLRKSLRSQPAKTFSQWQVARDRFTAPHAHLVEEGHEITSGKTRSSSGRSYSSLGRKLRGVKSYGMVAGRHMMQTATDETKDTFNTKMQEVFGITIKEWDE